MERWKYSPHGEPSGSEMIWTLPSEEVSTLINGRTGISAREDEGQALIGGEAAAETPSKGNPSYR